MAFDKSKFIAANVADYNQSHYIEMPEFEPGMLDFLKRDTTILNRIQTQAALGHPTRYWEQTKLPHNAAFINPRGGTDGKYGKDTVDDDYGRVEKSAMLKAITSRITYTLFDKQLVTQQDVQKELLNKDMQDMLVDIRRTQNDSIWNGTATNLMDTTHNDYCGLLTQITDVTTIANPFNLTEKTGEQITDAIRTKVAQSLADNKWGGRITALYANPLTIDYLSRAELKRDGVNIMLDSEKMDLGNGFVVNTIRTQAGILPIIPDSFIPVDSTSEAGKVKHVIVGLNESLVERSYLTSATPQIFKMGLDAGLLDDYVAVLFDTVILKGADSHAHFQLKFDTVA